MCVCKYECVLTSCTTNNKYNWPASTNEFNNNNFVAWLAVGLSLPLSPSLSLYLCLVFFQLICNFCLSDVCPSTANTDNINGNSNNGKSFRNWSKFPYTSISTQFPRWAALRALLLMCESLWIFIQYSFESDKNYCSLCVCFFVCLCVLYFLFSLCNQLVQLFHQSLGLILLMAA